MEYRKGQKVVPKTNHQQLMVVLEEKEDGYLCAWTSAEGHQLTDTFVAEILESADSFEGRTPGGKYQKDDLLLS